MNAVPTWPSFIGALVLSKILAWGMLDEEENAEWGCGKDRVKKPWEKRIQKVAFCIV